MNAPSHLLLFPGMGRGEKEGHGTILMLFGGFTPRPGKCLVFFVGDILGSS